MVDGVILLVRLLDCVVDGVLLPVPLGVDTPEGVTLCDGVDALL